MITISVVHPEIREGGWAFRNGFADRIESMTAASLPHGPRLHPGVDDCMDAGGRATQGAVAEARAAGEGSLVCGFADAAEGFAYLHEAYTATQPGYSGRVTVPVLWDRKTRAIVNNESADIIRMLNSEFDTLTDVKTDYYPKPLRREIDAVNALVYEDINNGVYRCGFASTQRAYDRAYDRLFAALDGIEARLGRARYLVGDAITEADWRLFTTLVRFDAVYYGHFKCNQRRIEDYPNLSNYLRDLYQQPGVAATVNLDHIKRHYYASHRHINPTGIVPKGPLLDFTRPHDRDRLAGGLARSG